jgi:glycine/D-amino acid oxidase-like deaminating enzyme
MADLARMRGAQVRTRQAVRSWRVDGGGVVVETDAGQLGADRLIVCAGAWAGPMLADLGLPLIVRRKVQLWYPVREYAAAWRDGPVFGFEIGDRFFYGFPSLDGTRIKVALHTGGEVVDDPSNLDRSLRSTDHEAVDEFVASELRGIEPTPIDHSVCMYTMTPDEHFVIDRHPEHPQIAFAAGFSGHGFKFAPIVGTILADYAIAGRTEEAAGFLRVRGQE